LKQARQRGASEGGSWRGTRSRGRWEKASSSREGRDERASERGRRTKGTVSSVWAQLKSSRQRGEDTEQQERVRSAGPATFAAEGTCETAARGRVTQRPRAIEGNLTPSTCDAADSAHSCMVPGRRCDRLNRKQERATSSELHPPGTMRAAVDPLPQSRARMKGRRPWNSRPTST